METKWNEAAQPKDRATYNIGRKKARLAEEQAFRISGLIRYPSNTLHLVTCSIICVRFAEAACIDAGYSYLTSHVLAEKSHEATHWLLLTDHGDFPSEW